MLPSEQGAHTREGGWISYNCLQSSSYILAHSCCDNRQTCSLVWWAGIVCTVCGYTGHDPFLILPIGELVPSQLGLWLQWSCQIQMVIGPTGLWTQRDLWDQHSSIGQGDHSICTMTIVMHACKQAMFTCRKDERAYLSSNGWHDISLSIDAPHAMFMMILQWLCFGLFLVSLSLWHLCSRWLV